MDQIKNVLKQRKVDFSLRKKGESNHILVKGDSSSILSYFLDESIDLIFTDPPYNASLNYGDTYKDNLSWEDYYDQAKRWFSQYARILKNTGTIYLINYPEVNARLLPYLEDELKLKLQRWITWHYPTNIGHSKKNFTRSQRSILFLTKSNKYFFDRRAILQLYENPDVGKVRQLIRKGKKGRGAYDFLTSTDFIDMEILRSGKNLFDSFYINLLKNVSKDRLDKKHPCQLPHDLIRSFVEVSTKKGHIVLDPFAGTYSTSLIASNLGRNSVGIELNKNFVELGMERFKYG